jgi:hypothetical protein
LNIIGYSGIFMEENHGFKHRVKSPEENVWYDIKTGKIKGSG